MSRDTTTIEVSTTTYKRLNARKGPSESFDEVLIEILNELQQAEKGDSDK